MTTPVYVEFFFCEQRSSLIKRWGGVDFHGSRLEVMVTIILSDVPCLSEYCHDKE